MVEQLVDIPTDYCCPITMELMEDPVVAADGHTYERASIEQWIRQGRRNSPLTGDVLRHTTLTDNITLKKILVDFKTKLPYIQREMMQKVDLELAVKLREEMLMEYMEEKKVILDQQREWDKVDKQNVNEEPSPLTMLRQPIIKRQHERNRDELEVVEDTCKSKYYAERIELITNLKKAVIEADYEEAKRLVRTARRLDEDYPEYAKSEYTKQLDDAEQLIKEKEEIKVIKKELAYIQERNALSNELKQAMEQKNFETAKLLVECIRELDGYNPEFVKKEDKEYLNNSESLIQINERINMNIVEKEVMIKESKYLAKRTELLNKLSAAIGEGDWETAKEALKLIKDLDRLYPEYLKREYKEQVDKTAELIKEKEEILALETQREILQRETRYFKERTELTKDYTKAKSEKDWIKIEVIMKTIRDLDRQSCPEFHKAEAKKQYEELEKMIEEDKEMDMKIEALQKELAREKEKTLVKQKAQLYQELYKAMDENQHKETEEILKKISALESGKGY